ncbi:MAG: DUF3159 domain-containing protein [Actinomycetia bacterium]|nr:DUF3159 domain-containing protein [Actinomycetes bacterium]
MNQEGLLEVLGGPRGLIDAGVPGAVFALAYTLTGQELAPSIAWAVGSGVVLFLISLAERRSVQQSLAGLVGVGVMAAVAAWTGQARDFYLPSVIKNAAYCAAYVVSILVRWPLLGVFLGPLFGEGFGWRKDPARLRSYSLASAVWAAMFGLRVAVQVPLYLTGQVAALGVVGIPLGLPLFMLTLWVTYLVLRRTQPVRQTAEEPPSVADEG